jgi:hypothetical protein
MGGNQARQIGSAGWIQPHYIATFSGTVGVRSGVVTTETVDATFSDIFADPSATNATLKLLQAVGSDETNLLAQHKLFTRVLDQYQIKHTFVTIPGGHTWHVWRRTCATSRRCCSDSVSGSEPRGAHHQIVLFRDACRPSVAAR